MVAARLPASYGRMRMLRTLNGKHSGSHPNTASATESKLSANSDGGHARAMANWDPSYPTEDVDWYGEYISRRAPIVFDWLQQPIGGITGLGETREVRGFGLLTGNIGSKVVAPLDDGSICLWNIGATDAISGTNPGGIIARSRPGLLSAHDPNSGTRSVVCEMKIPSAAVVESVSVDNASNKAYFATQNILNEVDLNTLQVVSHSSYPFPISALSDIVQPVPLTVGTSCTIHIKDFRLANDAQSLAATGLERLDRIATFPASPKHSNDFHRLLSADPQLNYAPLVHSSPLSILHSSSSGGHNSNDGEIHVAGRFPSILTYDRRTFPKLRNTIHSGARLCSMTCLPYPLASLERDLMQKNPPSVYAVREPKSLPGKTLIACGEYNGKGSLELYGLSNESAPSPSSSTPPPPGQPQISTSKNRFSASNSKLLSIAAHGTRLVFSDGNGTLKWVERDGRTLIRRWNLNKCHHEHTRGLFRTSTRETGPGDVARKLLPTTSHVNGARAPGDDLLLWTGERIGLLGFRKRLAFGADGFEEEAESAKERDERIYGETMRTALERQADEVRFVRGLGLGNRGP
ncbi:WD40-repeat-containing domain [Lasallia pustulata]|uniref:WD40-repeat-containing domain n=1 Tax=Lasallia pustulata TaxID=136370 RepID=A0A1W5D118_9LECA|nr:WD40-repeat-containing domain [Lasallia pustulata]